MGIAPGLSLLIIKPQFTEIIINENKQLSEHTYIVVNNIFGIVGIFYNIQDILATKNKVCLFVELRFGSFFDRISSGSLTFIELGIIIPL